MKTRKVTATLGLLLVSAFVASAFMLGQDTLGIAQWSKWSHHEKVIFLTGYRHAMGPSHDIPLATTNIQAVTGNWNYENMAKRIDVFYADPANTNVTIKGAIDIMMIPTNRVAEEAIRKKIDMERTKILWGF